MIQWSLRDANDFLAGGAGLERPGLNSGAAMRRVLRAKSAGLETLRASRVNAAGKSMNVAPSSSRMQPPTDHLLHLLKKSFGFDSFRPLQEEIIRDALADRDVFALLPTGAGKSLCFQLPALARPGLTVVISPLISLMKDQVDTLSASGVPATFLN